MKTPIALILALIALFSLFSCAQAPVKDLKVEDIHAICELATIKCYYNNVAQIEKTKENLFQRDRKMWIEYEGEAVLGIDMSKLSITVQGQEVIITMPEAQILSLRPNRSTLNEKSYVTSSDGFLFKNKITTEDQELAITKGQEQMRASIEANGALFLQAQLRAKELVENYVKQLGETIGKEYVITWQS